MSRGFDEADLIAAGAVHPSCHGGRQDMIARGSQLGRSPFGGHGVRWLWGLLLAAVFLAGCKVYIGGRPPKPPVETVERVNDGPPARIERGVVTLQPAQELDVFYPVPFVSPPNLQVESEFASQTFVVLEQKADHFRVRNESSFGFPIKLTWNARGVRQKPAAAAPPGIAPGPA